MGAERLEDTKNFRAVDGTLATGGQPTEQQLAVAAQSGFQVVINLALHDDPRYSLKDERGCVESQGMEYVHIPVQFKSPADASLLAFFDAMEAHRGRKILVHCAANIRVTAFVGLYRVLRAGWEPEKAFELMHTVWEPNTVWEQFIASMLGKHGGRAPQR